jgi:N-acetylglucosamine-6-sulfatase
MPRGVAAVSVLLVVGAAGLGLGGDDAGRAAAQAQIRPNIVLIETDDQTVESMRVLPRVRSLIGAAGVTFENSFASYPLCCPSRATVLTGQYAHNHGVLGNLAPDGGYYRLDSSNTLAVWLQRAGYYTAHLGKYLNGYGTRRRTEIPPGWSEWRGSVDPSSLRFNGYTLNENGRLTTYWRYQTDVYAAKAAELVRRRAASAQPFFLWIGLVAPHTGGPRDPDDPPSLGTPRPADRHRDLYASEPLPAPPSFNEADVSDKPERVRARPLIAGQALGSLRELYQQRLESLLAVDEAVGRIVAELDAAGELEHTLLVFTSDNGFLHGEHRIPNGKLLLYEPSIRVPLLMRGPGIPPGLRLAEQVANIDLAPTILDVAGARPGRAVDGRSLLPLLRDPGQRWGRDILIERPGTGDPAAFFAAIRTPRYLYAEYVNGDVELYDLALDPDQLDSKHADPAYAETRAELARRLVSLRKCWARRCWQGPQVGLRLACSGSALQAALGGDEERLATRFDVVVDGRQVASDSRAPFEVSLGSVRTGADVRAYAAFADGRSVNRDARAPECPGG